MHGFERGLYCMDRFSLNRFFRSTCKDRTSIACQISENCPCVRTHFRLSCQKFCHADVHTREQQASLLKMWKKSGQNCVFLVFPAKKLARFCHADLDLREHQGLPPDLFDHARSIAMADQNRE